MTYINRDPFAREELHRKSVQVSHQTCAWCGNVRRGSRLFRYRVESDGGRKSEDSKLFCSLDCRRSFYS